MAAWNFLQQHRASKSWIDSEDAWYVTQSFYLLRIESDTSATARGDEVDPLEDDAAVSEYGVSLQKLSSNPVFGRTIGASSSVLASLAEINRLSLRQRNSQPTSRHGHSSSSLTKLLLEYGEIDPGQVDSKIAMDLEHLDVSAREQRAQEFHVRAFKVATVIYYHQKLDNGTPEQQAPYVSEVLRSLFTFVELCGGIYTLWPAFIAGVELYKETDQEAFLPLFDNVASIGMHNRSKAKEVITKVWHIRSSTARDTGQSQGTIWVDWRQVMRDLEIDVLLV